MGYAQAIAHMTTAEFIAWEDTQADKHEFLAYAKVGAPRLHVTNAGKSFALRKSHLPGGPCSAYRADLKGKAKSAQAVFYADVLVTCHHEDLRAETVMHHPKVIGAGLAKATAAYARGAKFAAYHQLESHEEHALIAPDRRPIEVYRRRPGSDWRLAARKSGQGLISQSLGFVAAPAAVFKDVDSAHA